MIAIAVSIVLISIAVKTWHDLRIHFNNVKNGTAIGINHPKEAFYMALANTPALVLFTLASPLKWYYGGTLSLFMILVTVWTLFDGGYGTGKGKGFFYTGDKKYKDPAKTDQFLRRIPLWLHVSIKLIGMGGTIYLYVKTLN